MQIIAIYISIIPSTFKRKYTFIDDKMENSLHNLIPNSCHSSQEILRPCWWKSSPNLRVFANEIGNEWNLARPSDLWVISEYNFGSFSLFCLISTVSVQHHQCDPITLVKAISWIHYSITCKNVYAVIPSEYVGNFAIMIWWDLWVVLIQQEFIYSAMLMICFINLQENNFLKLIWKLLTNPNSLILFFDSVVNNAFITLMEFCDVIPHHVAI